jgi:hypothetical protein
MLDLMTNRPAIRLRAIAINVMDVRLSQNRVGPKAAIAIVISQIVVEIANILTFSGGVKFFESFIICKGYITNCKATFTYLKKKSFRLIQIF